MAIYSEITAKKQGKPPMFLVNTKNIGGFPCFFEDLNIQIFKSMIHAFLTYVITFSGKSKIISGKDKPLTTCPAWQISSKNYVGACVH